MSDAAAIALCQDYSRAKLLRSSYDNDLQTLREFVRPASSDFYTPGGIVTQPNVNVGCYDSTAIWAADQLSSGYLGFLMPSSDRWADVVLDNDEVPDREGQLWLDHVSDTLFREFGNPNTRFNSATQEAFYDLSGFGTDIMYMEYDYKRRHLSFRSYPIASCWLRENATGAIDTIYRSTTYTTRQLFQVFDKGILTAIEQVEKDQQKNERTWEVVHIVRPGTEDFSSAMKVKKKYMSTYILTDTKDTLKVGGYDYFPYIVGREKVKPGTVYGQSSGFTLLPAIKMLNAMMKAVIKAANKAIDPPIMVPSDGFMVPLKSDPAALWWYDPTAMNPDSVKMLTSQGRFDISDQLIADVRDQITRGFHVDWLIRNKKNERQTATEIMDDRDEMLRQLAPTLSRLEAEKVSPIIHNSYYLLQKAGRIAPAPSGLLRKKLTIRYQSPAARAQFGMRGADLFRYLNEITPMVNLWPSVVDTIDPDAMSEYLARIRNVPAIVLRDEEAKAAVRNQKEQQAQEQQMLEAAPAAGKTMLDLARAQEISGEFA